MSSRNLEENVVKMRFDNSEFDSNIDQSNDKVNEFKSTITSLPQNIYIGISNALSRISLSDIIGVGATLAGIGLIRQGIMGIGLDIQNVATSALRTINGVFASAINQINEGGKARAMNIANAKFQIEGLKLDVDTFMEAADYAVSGTAYGLDAAAKVASQLGASGVTELEELKKALRGVSGVAAMANSSYEEIGHLFTVIASNGRLMTEQIRSFSARGLNISAELAKSLNKTENEINDMVSKGKIDFKTFYTAMDEAFGEHAKDANKTFTGAMSNVRAALSRIGEGLWTPILDNSINVLNELRLSINAFKKELADNGVFTSFADHIKSIFDNASNMINLVKHAIEETAAIEQVSTVLETVFKIVDDIFNAFSFDYSFVVDEIIKNLSVIFFALNQVIMGIKLALDEAIGIRKLGGEFNSVILWFSRLFLILEDVRMLDIKDVFVTWFKAAKDVFTTVNDILGINRDNLSKIVNNIAEAFGTFFKNLKLSDDRIDKITRTFRGAASVLDIIKMLVSAIFNFIKPIFGYIPTAVDGMLTVSSAIGDWLYNLRNAIKEGEVFERLFDKISNICVFIKDLISKIGTNFFEAFFGEGSEDKTFLTKIKDFIKIIGETVSEAFNNLNIEGLDLGPIQEFINNLANFGVTSGDTSKAETILDKLSFFFGKVKEGFGKIGEFFQSHIFNIFTGENENFNKFTDFVGNLGDKFGGFLTAISVFLNDTAIPEAEAIAIVALIWKAMDCIKDIVIAFIQGFVELASIIANDFNGKDLIVPLVDKIVDKFLGNKTTGFFEKITTFFETFSQLGIKGILVSHDTGETEQAQLFNSLANMLKGLAWFFISIAASLAIISLIPVDRLDAGVKILTKFTIIIGVMALVLSVLNRVLPDFNKPLITFRNQIGASFIGGAATGGMTNTQNPLYSVGVAIAGIGAGLLAISAALFVIAQIDETKLDNAANLLLTFAFVFTLILAAFTVLNNKVMAAEDNGATYKGVGAAMLAMSAGLLLISLGFAAIAAVTDKNDVGKIVAIGAMLAAILVAVGVLIGFMSTITKNVGSSILTGALILISLTTMATLIGVLAASVIALSFVPEEKLKSAAFAISLLVGIIGGITVLLLVAASAIKDPIALAALAGIIGLFVAFAVDLVAIAAIVGAVALTVKKIADVVEKIKDILSMFKDMDETDADRIVDNITKVLVGIAGAIPKAIAEYYKQAIAGIAALFPKTLKFVSGQLLPFIDNLFGIVIPNLITKTIEGINALLEALVNYMPTVFDIFDNLIFTGGGLLAFIFLMLDNMWTDTVEWLTQRIPVWVVDILNLILILVTAINDAFENDWEDFDKQIQRLIDNTLSFVKDLLTNEKTKDDVSQLITGIFERIKEVVEENKDIIKEAFESIGRVMGSALLSGISETMPDNAIGNWISGLLGEGADSISQYEGYVSPVHDLSAGGYNVTSDYGYFNGLDFSNLDTSAIAGAFAGGGSLNTTSSSDSSSGGKNKTLGRLDVDVTVDGSPNFGRMWKGLNFVSKTQQQSGSARFTK